MATVTEAPAPRPKITVKQLAIIMEAIEENPSLYNPDSEVDTFENIEKWINLAEQLNNSDGGAQLGKFPNWKYVLNYWCENTKKKMNASEKRREAMRKKNPAITEEEAKELAALEKRLYEFMEKEELRSVRDVACMANLDEEFQEADKGRDSVAPNGDFKFVVELVDMYPMTRDECVNLDPEEVRKRTVTLHEDDFSDINRLTKKFRIVYEQSMVNQPQEEIPAETINYMSRKIEEHVASIQSRIHLIKDMWKHRCGDN